MVGGVERQANGQSRSMAGGAKQGHRGAVERNRSMETRLLVLELPSVEQKCRTTIRRKAGGRCCRGVVTGGAEWIATSGAEQNIQLPVPFCSMVHSQPR
jgi:hypothetical protein